MHTYVLHMNDDDLRRTCEQGYAGRAESCIERELDRLDTWAEINARKIDESRLCAACAVEWSKDKQIRADDRARAKTDPAPPDLDTPCGCEGEGRARLFAASRPCERCGSHMRTAKVETHEACMQCGHKCEGDPR